MDVFDEPVPTPGPGDALVRIERSGLCGTDLLVFDGCYRGRNRPVPYPLVPGHEAAGEVIDLGTGAAGPPRGTRVAIEALTGCGTCHHCVRGHYNLCPDWHHIGLTRAGAFADYIAVPSASLIALPSDVTLDSAAILEPLATAVHALERIKPGPATSAAIVGPGPLGFLHLQLLQAAGVGPIVMYGRTGDEERLHVARELGADIFIGDRQTIAGHAADLTNGIGFGVAIEAGGSGAATQTTLDIVAANGTVASLGIVPATDIDVLQVMRKNLTWIGVVASVRRHYAEAIELIRTGKIQPQRLITHRLPLERALDGFRALRERQAVKVMFSV
jgi:2-desacetyl-2-hydroxyethyl bacteriochlorophyllide A dehydrogenase